MAGQLISLVFAVLGLLGCVYLLAAIVSIWRFAARSAAPAPPSKLPPVVVLKPLHGHEPGLIERLRATVRQSYGAPTSFVFGARDSKDPALACVEQIREEFPAVTIRVIAGERNSARNPKIATLLNMASTFRRPTTVVVSDSDIEVSSDWLARVVAELGDSKVGAVTCLYFGRPLEGFWSKLTSLSINSHFLPSVTVALLGNLARPTFGSTIALRAEAYDAINGFASIADKLADDYALGEAVRATGMKVAFAPDLVGHACYERSFGELWRKELRWARTNRTLQPLGYTGTVVTHPLPLAVLGLLSGSSFCLALLLIALFGRLALCLVVERAFGVPRQDYWLIPFRDFLSFAVFVWSFAGRRIAWRDRIIAVDRDGTILMSERRLPS